VLSQKLKKAKITSKGIAYCEEDSHAKKEKASPVIATDDYFPGGAMFNSYVRENSTLNNFKYQSKEFQTDLAWQLSDFGPRQYDGWLLRTTTQDPSAEKFYPWSPYSWAFNNPLKFTDPTGKDH